MLSVVVEKSFSLVREDSFPSIDTKRCFERLYLLSSFKDKETELLGVVYSIKDKFLIGQSEEGV